MTPVQSRIEGSLPWRLPFILLVDLAVAFVSAVPLYLSVSPRWLQLHGRAEEADDVWKTLGVKVKDRQEIEEVLEDEVVDGYDTGAENTVSSCSGAARWIVIVAYTWPNKDEKYEHEPGKRDHVNYRIGQVASRGEMPLEGPS
ncbi:hypothetical protein BO70DRAFT_431734 [Aspergillus heteromorphus CBS 117.55]|uniref:Uncharacterized protein n=1 Tax=Aspergillus heteromorphus CBS 117.55 TaxID=1448321 RepID=A0A317VDA4_9EURO|nr:uncharacterized protein BO70DRAFT_431734 [Aspergillus heteromorphus CBS 117.55]PWY72354.1 hypothetical protein BO70DRAFT_431734 [Aspergillus heteromorphus CBS 117.55]